MGAAEKPNGGVRIKDKTVLKTLAQCSFAQGGEIASVDVKDGKIVRIRPHHHTERYTEEELGQYELNKDGVKYKTPLKGLLPPYQIAYKKRVYSPNRIKYPLKRVDWDPKGAPGSTGAGGRNTQNRGKSKYVRISWDEATTLIADEIGRIHKEYGPLGVLAHGDGHGETKTVHGAHAVMMDLLELAGGFTQAIRNADSWEGWFWGTKHVWGNGENGLCLPADNLMNDVTQHTDMILHIGADLETTPWGFAGQFPSNVLFYWQELGKKQVFVSPDLNYSGAVHATKWIPILPNTDAAMHLAIAYTWMTEGTYDKEYVATHVVGFDKFEDYVLGREDGVPKTPEWASAKTSIPEWTIKALAREWANQPTTVMHFYGGSYVRGPYSHEPARLEACLLGMQGLGKPGRHQYFKMGGDDHWMNDTPRPVKTLPDMRMMQEGLIEKGRKEGEESKWTRNVFPGQKQLQVSSKQIIPKTQLSQAILEGRAGVRVAPSSSCISRTSSRVRIPHPEGPGRDRDPHDLDGQPLPHHLLERRLSDRGSLPQPEDRDDRGAAPLAGKRRHPGGHNPAHQHQAGRGGHRQDVRRRQVGARRPDGVPSDRAARRVAERLPGRWRGSQEARSLRRVHLRDDAPREDGAELPQHGARPCDQLGGLPGQAVLHRAVGPEWETVPAGLREFYEDPEKYPLQTPSGKLEFYSQRLKDHYPDDNERGPLPKWVESSAFHDERIGGERAKKYPLLLMSNHGRWRTHAQNDDISWQREIKTCKIKGWDGYLYEPIWINPKDAAARGIKDGDIVKLFNERGTVLGAAYVWERIIPGALSMDHGARADLINVSSDGFFDRGGANNLISPVNGISQNCWGMATSGFLVDVAKLTMAEMEEWREKYPEAFARAYDPAAGLRFDAWVIEDGGEAR